MNLKSTYIYIKLVTAFAVTLLFACTGKSEDLQRFSERGDGPAAVGEGIILKYVDSGRVVATLKTPYVLDYAISPFPYKEFPKGVEVTFMDDAGKKNIVLADYAKQYIQTHLIDLREHVVIILSDSTTLKTDQLYWDERNNWIFTDEAYTIAKPDGEFNSGQGFDSRKDFKKFLSSGNTGRIYIKQEELAQKNDSVQ